MKGNKNKSDKKSKEEEVPSERINDDIPPGTHIDEPDDQPLKEGEDAIEMEVDQGEKIVYGSSFSPQDGDVGDESEDVGDLPEEGQGNRYDPTLSTGGRIPDQSAAIPEGVYITTEEDIGMAYNEDRYTEEADEEDEEWEEDEDDEFFRDKD